MPAPRPDDPRLARMAAGLTGPQRQAVEAPDAPLCVLAGAGSGKTTVLTRRVARRVLDGSAEARHTVVVTFTRKAAGELRSRLRRLQVPGGVWAGTFHAAAYAELRRHWADRGLRAPGLLDDPARLVRDRAVGGDALDADGVAAVVGEVQWAQSRLVTPDRYETAARAERRRTVVAPPTIASCYARYVEAKQARGLLDLGDLLVEAARLCEEDGPAADALRWRVRHLFVDEFQDVNPAQFRLLRAWLGERRDLFVVGDPRQSVYAWNGADPTLLDRIETLLPGTTVVRLDENHRSTTQVLRAAQVVLPDHAPDLEAAAPPDADEGPPPLVGGFADEAAEAAAVARWLRLAHRPGRAWSQMAVLARTGRRLDHVAWALRRAGIPHRRAGGAAPEERGGAADVLRALRRLPATQALWPALTDAAEAVGAPAVPLRLARLADEFAVEEPDAAAGPFCAWVAAAVGSIEDETEADDHDAAPSPDVGDDPARQAGRDGEIVLSTFHRAKGLEWPVVAIVGLEDGICPIAYATTTAARDEERRLLYVAVTRAERELWCSWARTRTVAGVERPCDPSPFVVGLQGLHPPRLAATDALARLAELRARLAATG